MPRKLKRQLVPPDLLTGAVIPSEAWECMRFVHWLERRQEDGEILLFSHIPNEARSASQRASNWKLGTRRGIPDYVVLTRHGDVVWVEMKRVKGASVRATKEQLDWVKKLSPHARICYGSDQAIRFVNEYLVASRTQVVQE